MSERNWKSRLGNIRLLGLDVDGVLTDGGVYIFEDGSEFRRFNIKDGLGLKCLADHGFHIVIISSASTTAIRHRAQRLGIQDVYLGVADKLEVLNKVCLQYGITLEEVAYIGDDLPDLPILNAVGMPCAPADAVQSVKLAACYVCSAAGGHGAVREICDLLLSSDHE